MKKQMANTKRMLKRAEKLRSRSERIGRAANSLHNEAISVEIDRALKSRLSPLHYRLISKVGIKDIIELNLKENWYLVGKEDGKISLVLLKESQLKDGGYKCLYGGSYPMKSLVGYYSRFITPEITARKDLGDLVFLNIGGQSNGCVGGLVSVPLEAIVSYKVQQKKPQ